MWDNDDHFGRWVQLICAFPLLLIGGSLLYLSFADFHSYYYLACACGLSCLVLGGRCIWYAVTGKNNVNKDL
jgi:hypothetical protein